MNLFISNIRYCIKFIALVSMIGCYNANNQDRMQEDKNMRISNRVSTSTYVRENVFAPFSKGAVTGLGIWGSVCACLFCWPCIAVECCINHSKNKHEENSRRSSAYVESRLSTKRQSSTGMDIVIENSKTFKIPSNFNSKLYIRNSNDSRNEF
jgi:hypothetical protein